MEPQTSAPADLRWFYRRTATGPLKSNFDGTIRRIAAGRARSEASAGGEEEDWLEDAARAGAIARVLRAVEPETEELLRRGYSGEGREEFALLGELAGLAPKTEAAARAYRLRERKRATFEEWLRELFNEQTSPKAIPTLQHIAAEAKGIRSKALSAYLAARRKVGRHGR